jgi:hypothetical protein
MSGLFDREWERSSEEKFVKEVEGERRLPEVCLSLTGRNAGGMIDW